MIKLYNTRTRKLEDFKPLKEGEVGVYSCGPTVYWNQHIGNMYAFSQWDFLVRFLRFMGYKVKWVMNITDVGHLTSDEDTGEDKMEKGAKREGVSVWDVAEKYIEQFKESLELLNISMPDVLCRATEHLPEQIDLVKKIEANGFTYQTKTGVVFDTSKFPGYSDFAKLDLTKQEAGSRVQVDLEKKNPWDFLLWVTNQPNHVMQWDSPWGRGFPGWHLECTAMSVKYLGENFDIHTGGKEHIPVHHTNEIAQGFGAFGHQTANFWLHNEWLRLKNEKLAKSGGNAILVTDLTEKGFSPMHLRYLYLNSQYQTGLDFSWESLTAAKNAFEKLVSLVRFWKADCCREVMGSDDPEKINKFRDNFINALSDNLNLPQALAITWKMAKSDLPSPDKLDLILEFDQVLGLNLGEVSNEGKVPEVSKGVMDLVNKREETRKSGNWEEADKIRQEIKEQGYLVEDTVKGTAVKKIS